MLKTASEYLESLKKLKPNLYLLGEKVEDCVENPIIRPSTNAVAMTYKMALEPKLERWSQKGEWACLSLCPKPPTCKCRWFRAEIQACG